MESGSPVIESQLDWLTVGTHSVERTDVLRGLAELAVRCELREGGRVKPFRLQGYTGWQCGRVRFGQREAYGLVQLSGDLAAHRFDEVYRLADNVSRLDLAVTTRVVDEPSHYPAAHYAEARALRERHPRSALPQLVEDGDGGATCYLGHRTSDFYLRIYNKQAECLARHDAAGAAHYVDCVRYELEVKGANAPRWAQTVHDAEDRADVVQALVWSFCLQHGLQPPFRARRRPTVDTRVPAPL